jgi:hypothetical protein
MEGGGFYAAHSRPQRGAASFGLAMLERACAEVVLPPAGASIVVADLGAAQGRNELEPLSIAVRALAQRRRHGTPILVVHTDLPTNDFASLFAAVERGPGSYLRAAPDVYPYVAGRSFYSRVFPDEHVTVGWTAIAVHWLSELPAELPDTVYPEFATGTAAEAFRERARRDWLEFLLCRERELRPGGQLVVVGGAAAADGSSGAEPLMGTLSEAVCALVDAGRLRPEELARMTIPTWNRTAGEYAAPLRDGSVGLELLELEEAQLPDSFRASLDEGGDRAAFARQVTGFVRAFTEPSLVSGLDERRTLAERAGLMDALYEAVRFRAERQPGDVEACWRVVVLRLARPV